TRMHGGVGGTAPQGVPLSRSMIRDRPGPLRSSRLHPPQLLTFLPTHIAALFWGQLVAGDWCCLAAKGKLTCPRQKGAKPNSIASPPDSGTQQHQRPG